ncbi:MAG: FtsX-like permease family protein [Candidatus Dormibacteraceae bacterium]
MFLTAVRELVSRRAATALAALGLLTASLGFMLLASTSSTTQAVLTGDIGAAWASPYDILVRPTAAAVPLETSSSLVRPNFLSAAPSGITLQELAAVQRTPGVEVAAPIAIIGVTQLGSSVPMDLSKLMDGDAVAAFRLSPTIVTDGGFSHFPMQPIAIVVAPGGTYNVGRQTLTVGSEVIPCTKALCFGGKAICPQAGLCSNVVGDLQHVAGLNPGQPGADIYFPIPVTLAGIDPDAENKLSGIAGCVTSGHYLQQSSSSFPNGGAIPVLMSDRTLLNESVDVTISRTASIAQLIAGQDAEALSGWQSLGVQTLDPNIALRDFEEGITTQNFPNLSPVWVPGPLVYSQGSDGVLVPSTQSPNLNAYQNPYVLGQPADFNAPPEAHDVWFRGLQDRYQTGSSGSAPNQWNIVGDFNPNCLPSFSNRGAGELAPFVPPIVTTTDGKAIGPNRSIAGFLDSPPLMLTSLAGAQYFSDPTRFAGAPGSKFISAIRVKVSGTDQLGKPAEERLSRVAAAIRDATGLQVDIVKGSSPLAVQIALPAGNFGRPALTVTQGWASKGIAFTFLQAVSTQNLAIFALVLVGALILVAQTAYVSVRRRRRELAVLRAMGWPPWRIAQLIELEMLVLGLAVGTTGLVIGVPLTMLARLNATWWTTAGVVPLSIVIALIAGAVPAISSSRGSTLGVIVEQEPVRQRQLPSSAVALGVRQVTAWRWDVAMGIAALALGAALLAGVELIAAGFSGQLDATILGTYLSGQVKPFHFVVAGLTLAIGALAAAEVITLAYLERRVELATLRALGWPRLEVVKVLLGQAIGLGVIAAAVAVTVSIVAGVALSASPLAILGSAATALAMTVVATCIAVVAPLGHAYAADTASSLRGE